MAHILISGLTGSLENYIRAIEAVGGSATSGYCPAPDLAYDGLLLCGGGDIDPSFFGQENTGSTEIDLERDRAELALARAYLSAGKPILGICRGMQLINVVLGGTLLQDIGDVLRPMHRAEGLDLVHGTTIAPDSFLGQLYGGSAVVNTTHHQAIDRLGEGLFDIQWAESGLIEALQHQTLPVWGVQWHPERMSFEKRRPDTVDGAPLFEAFLRCCHGR